MKALPLIALLAVTAAAGTAAEDRPRAPLEVTDLTFSSEAGGGRIEVRSARGRSHYSIRRARLSDSSGLDEASGDGQVRFAIVAEAGRTDCTGSRSGRAATGTCRFRSDPGYEVGLAQRGVTLEARRDLLALALVDAPLSLVDDLSRLGLSPGDSGNLIAAAALGVTGAWAREIKDAGLRIEEFEDLIAARALDVDPAYLRGMRDAGYPALTASQAIAMKAVGVTPSYAAAMNHAANAVEAAEHLQ